MARNDEYEQFYGCGFEFGYRDKRLLKSKPVFKDQLEALDPAKRGGADESPLFVKCLDCGEYMDFTPGPSRIADGFWTCPACGAKVKERSVYLKLSKENDQFLNISGLT